MVNSAVDGSLKNQCSHDEAHGDANSREQAYRVEKKNYSSLSTQIDPATMG